MGKRLPVGDELENRAKELGVSIEGDLIRGTVQNVRHPRATDCELRWRVHEAERSIQGGRLWWVAFLSALASLASAIPAWVAVARSVAHK